MIHPFIRAALVLACCLPGSALAHRSWLLPSATVVDAKDAWVTIDAAISENLFDIDTTGLKLDGLSVTGPDGARVAPENLHSAHLRNSFDLHLVQPGSYTVSVVTQTAMASYQLNGELKRWRGSEEALAKEVPANAQDLKVTHLHARVETFVSAGVPGKLASHNSGVGLELEPITHPNDLRAGEPASWRILKDGKPAANLAFSLVPGGVRYRGVLGEIRLSTDANGVAALTLPAAGMYWLNASDPGAVAQGSMPARRLSYAATLEVLPE